MRILRFAFAGFVFGFILGLVADRSVWLEMRMNTGLFLPVTTSITVVTGLVFKRRIHAATILSLEIFLVGLLLFNYGFSLGPLVIIPASLFRDGFMPASASLKTANCILAGLLLFGNGLLFSPLLQIFQVEKANPEKKAAKSICIFL